jgi:hypothetical protein
MVIDHSLVHDSDLARLFINDAARDDCSACRPRYETYILFRNGGKILRMVLIDQRQQSCVFILPRPALISRLLFHPHHSLPLIRHVRPALIPLSRPPLPPSPSFRRRARGAGGHGGLLGFRLLRRHRQPPVPPQPVLAQPLQVLYTP